MKSDEITIREGNAEDLAFVYSSWLKSYLATSLFTRGVPRQLAFQNHKRIVACILARSTMFVASPRDDAELILGYVVAEKLGSFCVLHYAYMKDAYRRFGFTRALISTAHRQLHEDLKLPMMASHMTEMGRFLKSDDLIYNPYLLITGDYFEAKISKNSATSASIAKSH